MLPVGMRPYCQGTTSEISAQKSAVLGTAETLYVLCCLVLEVFGVPTTVKLLPGRVTASCSSVPQWFCSLWTFICRTAHRHKRFNFLVRKPCLFQFKIQLNKQEQSRQICTLIKFMYKATHLPLTVSYLVIPIFHS